MVVNFYQIPGLPFFLWLEIPFPYLIKLSVKACGKQKEGIVRKRKPLTSLVNPTLAQQDRLPSARQRIADHLPFFESNRHSFSQDHQP